MKIYPRNDKRRVYWLIDQYLADKIDENSFCDEYYYSYDLAIDKKTLNNVERKAFEELSMIAGRFSGYESDFMTAPGVYSTREELRDAIAKTKEALDQQVGVRSYDVELNLISAYWCHEVASSNEDMFSWAYEEIQALTHEISEVSLQTLVALATTAPTDYLMANLAAGPLEDYINLVVEEERVDQADFIINNPYLKSALPET